MLGPEDTTNDGDESYVDKDGSADYEKHEVIYGSLPSRAGENSMGQDKLLKQWALNHGWVRTPGRGPGAFAEWSHPGVDEGHVPLLGEEVDSEGTLSQWTREKMLVHQAKVHEADQLADREFVRQRETRLKN